MDYTVCVFREFDLIETLEGEKKERDYKRLTSCRAGSLPATKSDRHIVLRRIKGVIYGAFSFQKNRCIR